MLTYGSKLQKWNETEQCKARAGEMTLIKIHCMVDDRGAVGENYGVGEQRGTELVWRCKKNARGEKGKGNVPY